MAASYGKYDNLNDDERRRLARIVGLKAAAWSLAAFVLGWLDHHYQLRAVSFIVELIVDVAYVGIALRAIVLTFRAISIQSPNPKRSPPKN